jgi:hypothetical protein
MVLCNRIEKAQRTAPRNNLDENSWVGNVGSVGSLSGFGSLGQSALERNDGNGAHDGRIQNADDGNGAPDARFGLAQNERDHANLNREGGNGAPNQVNLDRDDGSSVGNHEPLHDPSPNTNVIPDDSTERSNELKPPAAKRPRRG